MSHRPVRVAVVGVGHVGAFHANIYKKLFPRAELVAVCDSNQQRAKEIAHAIGCRAFADARQLVGQAEAVSVCVPTSAHYQVAKPLLEAGLHVLIEKPITPSLKEADVLLAIAKRRKLILQVGHIERFNAAIQAAKAYLAHPRFIEAHRLSSYPFRGTDVSVVLDVMIHDLDLVLALVGSHPLRVDAVGIPVLSKSEDLANARLVFGSGCVANLTASRVSDEALRRIRVFQEDAYLSIDYKAQTVELVRLRRGRGRQSEKTATGIERTSIDVQRRAPLDEQLAAFIDAVRTGTRPLVSGEEAREALALALRIEQAMRRPLATSDKRQATRNSKKTR